MDIVPESLIYVFYTHLDEVDAWNFSRTNHVIRRQWDTFFGHFVMFDKCGTLIIQRRAWSLLRWLVEQGKLAESMNPSLIRLVIRHLFLSHCDLFFDVIEACSISQAELASILHYEDMDFILNPVAGRLLYETRCLLLWNKFVECAITRDIDMNFPHPTLRVDPYTCMVLAAQHGKTKALAWAHSRHARFEKTPLLIDMASTGNHLDTLQWLHSHRQDGCTNHAILQAINRGHLEAVKWLHLNNYVNLPLHKLINCAARARHHSIVLWLHIFKGAPITSVVLESAAEAGNLYELTYLVEEASPSVILNSRLINCAAKEGHLDTLHWLQDRGFMNCTSEALELAAEGGYLQVLEWLYRLGLDFTEDTLNIAASRGHFEVVQWLHHHGATCTTWAMDAAAANGHIHVLKWLHENRTEGCTNDAMDSASSNGELAVIKWLHEHRREGCTSRALSYAVEAGFLEIAKWLLDKKPWTSRNMSMEIDDAFVISAMSDHVDLIKWLAENHEISSAAKELAFWEAARSGNTILVDWLYSCIDTFTNANEAKEAFRIAASAGHMKILCYLLEKGFYAAAMFPFNDDEIIQWRDNTDMLHRLQSKGLWPPLKN